MPIADAYRRLGIATENLLALIAAKKAELDRLRIRAPGGTTNFDHSQDIELTYTSNAIEGNTLTAVETTMVIEHGITVAGKPLKDHLEAIDHYDTKGANRPIKAWARVTQDQPGDMGAHGQRIDVAARMQHPLLRLLIARVN